MEKNSLNARVIASHSGSNSSTGCTFDVDMEAVVGISTT